MKHLVRVALAATVILAVSIPAGAATIYVNEAAFITDAGPLGFESFEEIPYRKLVNAICRVARRESGI